ncbi:hypothetical protein MN608_11697 [Microdochium nivale]|nr:hypothetical protein MN608_11697 [Microdochium nivale]
MALSITDIKTVDQLEQYIDHVNSQTEDLGREATSVTFAGSFIKTKLTLQLIPGVVRRIMEVYEATIASQNETIRTQEMELRAIADAAQVTKKAIVDTKAKQDELLKAIEKLVPNRDEEAGLAEAKLKIEKSSSRFLPRHTRV